MPYSNIQGATPNSLVSIAVYLADTKGILETLGSSLGEMGPIKEV